MSASEKLRQLERRTRDLRFHHETKEEAERAVLAALPVLIGVVEATENLYARVEMDESVGTCLSSRVESLNAGQALAALDEALS